MSSSPAPNVVVVLAAIIERDGSLLVTRRLQGTHLAGLWEFPGGKCEPGESHEACLRRELEEELGIEAVVGEEIYSTEHAYPERTIRLHFRLCAAAADPVPRLGQEMRWMTRAELDPADFPPADAELIGRLRSEHLANRRRAPRVTRSAPTHGS
jgi:8-oxo-dGTP diphosphatase